MGENPAANPHRLPGSRPARRHDPAIEVRYRAMVRLQVAEAERRGLNHIVNGSELDTLYEALSSMTHEQRLLRLAQLGERTDDLQLRGRSW